MVLSPHLGYVARETYDALHPDMVEELEAFIAGRPIRLLAPR